MDVLATVTAVLDAGVLVQEPAQHLVLLDVAGVNTGVELIALEAVVHLAQTVVETLVQLIVDLEIVKTCALVDALEAVVATTVKAAVKEGALTAAKPLVVEGAQNGAKTIVEMNALEYALAHVKQIVPEIAL